MGEFAIELIKEYGYFGMFLGMVLEAVIIAIPSEAILATGGILASQKIFSFIGAFITGIIGSTFCAIVIYFMGYLGGKPFIKKYGKYFFMKEEDIEKSNSWFNKYGLIASLISLPIGIMRLSFIKFIIYTIIGSIPWTFVFVYIGYTLGNNWIKVNNYVGQLKTPIKILLVAVLISYIIKIFFNKTKKITEKN